MVFRVASGLEISHKKDVNNPFLSSLQNEIMQAESGSYTSLSIWNVRLL